MARNNVQVLGVEKTLKEMFAFEHNLKEEAWEAITETAKDVKREQVSLVRKDELDLKKSIGIKGRKRNMQKTVGPDYKKAQGGNLAHFHEYGTTKMRPKPFVKPSEMKYTGTFRVRLKEITKNKVII